MAFFEDFRERLLAKLGWLQGPNARKWFRFPGQFLDIELEATKDAIKARFPSTGPDDALDKQGRDRDLERFPGETDVTYRNRISDPFAVWAWAGTALGIKNSLNAYGIETVEIYEDHQGHFCDGEWYSRFWVVIGDGTPGSTYWEPLTAPFTPPVTGGTTATRDEVCQVLRQILKWKSAHGYPVKVIFHYREPSQNAPVILGGINSIPPFRPQAGPNIAWALGKTQGDTITTAPWVAGGFMEC